MYAKVCAKRAYKNSKAVLQRQLMIAFPPVFGHLLLFLLLLHLLFPTCRFVAAAEKPRARGKRRAS